MGLEVSDERVLHDTTLQPEPQTQTDTTMFRASPMRLLAYGLLSLVTLYWLTKQHHMPSVNTAGTWEANIRNSTLGFERIYVLNMPRRSDRRDAFSLAAAYSGFSLDWIRGIDGEDVDVRTLPEGGENLLSSAELGIWRAHLNALRVIIEQDVQSALIIEDDADWDVRIKSQLVDFARASTLLTQPLLGTENAYLDPTFPSGKGTTNAGDIPLTTTPAVRPPTLTPYGDAIDVLWLGHCGTSFPTAADQPTTPRGRVVHTHDATVPQTQHLATTSPYSPASETGPLAAQYPNNTRVYHHAANTSCTLAYAVTQSSARRILYDVGIRSMTGAYDRMLCEYCDGRSGRKPHTCVTATPALFKTFEEGGKVPEVGKATRPPHGDRMVLGEPFTPHVRVSTQINLKAGLAGLGLDNMLDSFPDERPARAPSLQHDDYDYSFELGQP